MKIAFLSQEFEVVFTRTVREEFMSAFGEAQAIITRLEEVQKALETATDDMDRMASLLDELSELQKKADRADVYSLTSRIDKMMPTLGFDSERDSDRLVASYSGGWQMRMGLGKILLQEPDLLLLDEVRQGNRGQRGAFVPAADDGAGGREVDVPTSSQEIGTVAAHGLECPSVHVDPAPCSVCLCVLLPLP